MEENESVFTAKDVQEVAGLSYRQLNDWDARGSLPHKRDEKGSWRRFSPRDIFVLMVLNEIRTRFGIPINRLQSVREFMLQEDADHLSVAIKLIALLGVGVWIMTDLEDTFVMDSELEMIELWEHRIFGGGNPDGYIFIKVNPLVNRLLAARKDPIELPTHGRGYEIMQEIRERYHLMNEGEVELLAKIRSAEYRKVEVTLSDGEVQTIRTTTNRDETAQLADILAEHDFQRLVVTTRKGRVVSVEQQTTERMSTSDPSIAPGEAPQ